MRGTAIAMQVRVSPTDINWCPPTPIKLVMSTLTYTVLKVQSQQGGRGGSGTQLFGQLSHTVRTPQPRDWALFLISESGQGEGAQLLASRPDYMGFAMQATIEWKTGYIWDILATYDSSPTALGLEIIPPPPLFPSFVWEGSAVFYPPRPDYM